MCRFGDAAVAAVSLLAAPFAEAQRSGQSASISAAVG